MALPDLWSKLKEGGAKAAVRFWRIAGALFGDLRKKFSVPVSTALRQLRDLPAGRRRLVFAGFGAFLAALLLFLVIFLILSPGGPEGTAGAPPVRTIPPEDIFLPEEPDFIPSFIPGRERREFWTGEDAAVYWQDPLRGGEEAWRGRIESVIDELLERVP
ncbi:MAG: hypothetical protein LBS06_04465 [Treponema sp.]|jgi:hypothetical protein|nr:hypothetical protein [Treponema sp.]